MDMIISTRNVNNKRLFVNSMFICQFHIFMDSYLLSTLQVIASYFEQITYVKK